MTLGSCYNAESYHSVATQAGEQDCFLTGIAASGAAKRAKTVIGTKQNMILPQVMRPKILLYSHDTFGLGNIRRTLLLAENLQQQYPKASILIITGSPVIHAFRLPEGIDYIKLPSLDRVKAEEYEPLFLPGCGGEVRATRIAILEKVIVGFRPDLFIVDKRATGIDGELIGALEILKERNFSTKIILGLRDILDAPEKTSKTLRDNGSFQAIEEYYDEVWIYGTKEIFDAVNEYKFPDAVAKKTRYCGYLKRRLANNKASDGTLRVLVTPGGGGDGSGMVETFLTCLPLLKKEIPVSTIIVFGPQMHARKRRNLLERFGVETDTRFLDFEPDLTHFYAEADVVVSMAGYNTVCELLSLNKRAVLVPRSEPVQEQLIRARLMAGNGFFEYIEPTEMDAETMRKKIMSSLKTISINKYFLDLDGLPHINERVHSLLMNKEESYV